MSALLYLFKSETVGEKTFEIETLKHNISARGVLACHKRFSYLEWRDAQFSVQLSVAGWDESCNSCAVSGCLAASHSPR